MKPGTLEQAQASLIRALAAAINVAVACTFITWLLIMIHIVAQWLGDQ